MDEEFDGNEPFDCTSSSSSEDGEVNSLAFVTSEDEDDEADSLAHEQPLVIVKQNPLNRPSKLHTTEIELMNIVRTSQLPLNTFKKIWNWVGRGQVRNVNFSNPGRVQTTVVDKF